MRRKKKKSLQNKIAMVSVTFVVGVLFIGLMAESSRLKGKVAEYETKKRSQCQNRRRGSTDKRN